MKEPAWLWANETGDGPTLAPQPQFAGFGFTKGMRSSNMWIHISRAVSVQGQKKALLKGQIFLER